MGFLVQTIQKNEKTILQPTGMVVFIAQNLNHMFCGLSNSMRVRSVATSSISCPSPQKMRGRGSKLSLKTKSKPEPGAEWLKCSGVWCPRPPPGHLLSSSIGIPKDTYSSFCRASLGHSIEGVIVSQSWWRMFFVL